MDIIKLRHPGDPCYDALVVLLESGNARVVINMYESLATTCTADLLVMAANFRATYDKKGPAAPKEFLTAEEIADVDGDDDDDE